MDKQTKTLYVGSINRYNTKIPVQKIRENFERLDLKGLIKNIPIYGFEERWLAGMSLIDSNKIKKGVLEEDKKIIPFVEEVEDDGFECLDKSCYIYKVKVDTKNLIFRIIRKAIEFLPLNFNRS